MKLEDAKRIADLVKRHDALTKAYQLLARQRVKRVEISSLTGGAEPLDTELCNELAQHFTQAIREVVQTKLTLVNMEIEKAFRPATPPPYPPKKE